MSLVERQVFVTWYTPAEKKPPEEWDVVLVTVSGKKGVTTYDHAFALAAYDKDDGWMLWNDDMTEFTIHAWADIEPYKGGRT